MSTSPVAEPAAARPGRVGARPFVFVIDDDDVMLLSCRRILEKDGYAVETFECGAAGLARLAEVRPHLLLVDLKMPELDGLGVIARVRQIDPGVIIAVITGYATIATAVDAMKAGAYDFLPKPFTPDELRLVVRRGCERWRLGEEARQLRIEKEAAERRIITFVSHQLKSPLAAAKQYLDVLLHTSGDTLPGSATEWIGRAQSRLQEMLALIDDWLTLAHAERGTLGVQDSTSDLAAIVDQLLEVARPHAERAHVHVRANVPAGLPLVKGDSMSLATVVSNVLTNAIKYNRRGGDVNIQASASPNSVMLEVTDSGIGIPEESLPRIFDEFYRAPGAREIAGTGLGLAICRRVLQELGGSIEASSRPGSGSVFTITLPRADDRSPDRSYR